jgi:signal transduction histidine kinase
MKVPSTVNYFFNNPIAFYGILLAAFLIIQIVYVYLTRFERIITVKEKHEFSTGKYIRNTISDEEGNVYQIQSSLPLLHFREAEIWLQLEKNRKYTILAYGWRIPILGLYPNIVGLGHAN